MLFGVGVRVWRQESWIMATSLIWTPLEIRLNRHNHVVNSSSIARCVRGNLVVAYYCRLIIWLQCENLRLINESVVLTLVCKPPIPTWLQVNWLSYPSCKSYRQYLISFCSYILLGMTQSEHALIKHFVFQSFFILWNVMFNLLDRHKYILKVWNFPWNSHWNLAGKLNYPFLNFKDQREISRTGHGIDVLKWISRSRSDFFSLLYHLSASSKCFSTSKNRNWTNQCTLSNQLISLFFSNTLYQKWYLSAHCSWWLFGQELQKVQYPPEVQKLLDFHLRAQY